MISRAYQGVDIPESHFFEGLVETVNQSGIPEERLRQFISFYSPEDFKVIFKSLSPSMLRVEEDSHMFSVRDYIHLARIESMPDEELRRVANQAIIREEHIGEYRRITFRWTEQEHYFIKNNLSRTLGRIPTPLEVSNALETEILDSPRSPSKKCRAFFALAHPDKVSFIEKSELPSL